MFAIVYVFQDPVSHGGLQLYTYRMTSGQIRCLAKSEKMATDIHVPSMPNLNKNAALASTVKHVRAKCCSGQPRYLCDWHRIKKMLQLLMSRC